MPANGEMISSPADSRFARQLHDAARIAGRVAHDFDNLLMGISGFAELAQRVTAADAPATPHLSSLLKVVHQGKDATRRLHEFSRCGLAVCRPTDSVSVWRQVWSRFRDAAGLVQLTERGLTEVDRVAIGADALGRVYSEVVANALDAMPDGGELAVDVQPVAAIGAFEVLGPLALPPGRYVRWTLADSGRGLRPGVREQLESGLIATTRPKRRGLGLPIVLRTLIVHGGGLRLDGAVPRGVAAILYLPVASPAARGCTR